MATNKEILSDCFREASQVFGACATAAALVVQGSIRGAHANNVSQVENLSVASGRSGPGYSGSAG